MSIKRICGLAACLLLPLALGCNAGPGVVRGQSPAGDYSFTGSPSAAIQQVGHGDAGMYAGAPVMYGHAGQFAPAACSSCQGHGCSACQGRGGPSCACAACLGRGCYQCGGDGCCGYGFCPYHRRFVHYKRPNGLVYPPPNQPAAVVQYPYYTVRGPTDFFLE